MCFFDDAWRTPERFGERLPVALFGIQPGSEQDATRRRQVLNLLP